MGRQQSHSRLRCPGEAMSLRWLARIGVCSLLTLSPPLSFMANAVTTVTVKVTVIAPPACIINNNKAIEVEFGNVMTTQVDGSHYRMPVNYTLDCDAKANNAMTLQVQGTGAAFDTRVLQTTVPALGIALQNGTTMLPINSWVNFTYPTKPELWAVPVKAAGVTLQAGEFSAASTMRVDYQ